MMMFVNTLQTGWSFN